MLICSGLFLCKKLMTKGKAGNEMYTLQNPARFISYGADKVDTGNIGAGFCRCIPKEGYWQRVGAQQ